MADNVSDEIHDGLLVHSVSLLRVAAGERQKVLSMLEALEAKLIADLNQQVGKTPHAISKLQALLKQTQGTISQAYADIAANNGKALAKIAQLEATKTVNTINTALKVGVATVGQTPEQLAAIAGKVMIAGKHPSEWWASQGKALQDKFSAQIREGMLKGESIDDMTRRIRGTKAKAYTDGIMQASKAQATALVRTSVLTTANEAKIATIMKQGKVVKGIQWVATLDGRTSDICKALDGKQWTVPDLKPVGHDKKFPGPIAHWQCRSTQIPVTRSWAELAGPNNKLKTTEGIEGNYEEILKKKMEAAGMKPAAVQAAVGKQAGKLDGNGTSGTVTFEDWLKGKPDSDVDAILGPGKAKLWRDGKITVSQMTDQDNRPLTLAELKEMVAKNEAVPPPKEGQDGLSLQERKLLEDSLAYGVKNQKVLAHFVNADTGETLSIEGTGVTAEQLAKLQAVANLHVLQNTLGKGEVWTAEQFQLFGTLQGFKKATLVGPTGRTFAVQVKAGQVFTDADAKDVLAKFAALKNVKTIPQTQQKFGSAVSQNGTLKATLGKADVVKVPPGTYNEQFGPLLEKPAPYFDAAAEQAKQATIAAEAAKQAEIAKQTAAAQRATAKAIAEKADLQADARAAEVQAAADALLARKAAENAKKVLEAKEAEAAKLAAEQAAKNAAAQAEIADTLANPKGKTLIAKNVGKLMKEQPHLEPHELLAQAKAQALVDQAKASQAAALSGYKKKALAGMEPTPAQKKALAGLSPDEQKAFLDAVAAAKKAAEDAAAKAAADAAAQAAAQQAAAAAAVAASKPVVPMPAPGQVPVPLDFPDDPNNLTVVKVLGGSTGAQLVKDADGNLYVRKRGANPEHVREEVIADALYRGFGANVPECRLYDTPAGPVKLARFVDGGETLKDWLPKATQAQKDAMKAELQKHFAADALLGNWDVLGTSRDNVLIDKAGKVWRIDNGGSLRFRAQGQKKAPQNWHEFADELWTMRGQYHTPMLKDLQQNIAASFQSDFQEFFGGLSIYDIARQVEGMPVDVLGMAPDEVRVVLEKRLAHLKAIAATSLDLEHVKWLPGVADNIARNSMEMRHKGVVARMVAKMTLTQGTPQMLDENGNPFDELRSKKAFGAQAVNPTDPLADKVLQAVISINAHAKKGTGQFANAAKVQQVLAHKPILKQWAVGTDPAKKALAAHYLPWVAAIEDAQTKHTAGTLKPATPGGDVLPKFDQTAGAMIMASHTNPAAVAPLKPATSITQDVSAYISTLGGDATAVTAWMGDQAGHSWAPRSLAMKYFVATSKADPSVYFWGSAGMAGAKAQFDQLAASVGGEANLRATFTAWVAYTQEILSNTALPNKDDKLRAVRLIRTEEDQVLSGQGIALGKYGGVHVMKKGINESHGSIAISVVHGHEVTVQAVPFGAIHGLYITERPGKAGAAGNGSAAFIGDSENEYTADTNGIPFVYAGHTTPSGTMLHMDQGPDVWKQALKPGVDAGDDATKWMVPIHHLRLQP